MTETQPPTEAASATARARFTRRHLILAWALLLVFLCLGIALEAMHGLKLGLYLDLENETRRHLWTLAHAHGVLLALVHAVFALTLFALPGAYGRWVGIASPLLVAASILMPAGFFLGGVVFYGGDPGFGVLLVPVGGAALLVAVLLALRGTLGTDRPKGPPES
jgi:hypothetical protein